jgi:hypothetical protein
VARGVCGMWGGRPNAPSDYQRQMMLEHGFSRWHFGDYDAVKANEIIELQQLFWFENGQLATRDDKIEAMDAKVLKNWNTAKEDCKEWDITRKGLYINYKTEKLDAKFKSIGVEMGGGLNGGVWNSAGRALRQRIINAKRPWSVPNLHIAPNVQGDGDRAQPLDRQNFRGFGTPPAPRRPGHDNRALQPSTPKFQGLGTPPALLTPGHDNRAQPLAGQKNPWDTPNSPVGMPPAQRGPGHDNRAQPLASQNFLWDTPIFPAGIPPALRAPADRNRAPPLDHPNFRALGVREPNLPIGMPPAPLGRADSPQSDVLAGPFNDCNLIPGLQTGNFKIEGRLGDLSGEEDRRQVILGVLARQQADQLLAERRLL